MQNTTTKKTATKGVIRYGHTESRGKANRTQYLSVHKVQRSDELLEFLLKKLNTSRNNVKALLSRRQVLVNGSVITQYNFALAKDDEVKIARESVREEAGRLAAQQAKRGKSEKILPDRKSTRLNSSH